MAEPLPLPCQFDIDFLSKAFFERKHIGRQSQRNYKNSLRLIQTDLDIKEITLEVLNEIDEYISTLRNQDYKHDKYSVETLKPSLIRIWGIMNCLFSFDFPKSRSLSRYRHLLNKTDDLTFKGKLPQAILEYSSSDPQVYQWMLGIRDYMNNKKFADAYITRIMSDARRILVPLKKGLLDETLNRNDIISHIQQYEDNQERTKIKTRNPAYREGITSYTIRDLCRAFNIIMSCGIFPFLSSIKCVLPSELKTKAVEVEIVKRDYFTDEELIKITDSYESPMERLIFTLFLTVGLRINGLSSLRIKNLFEEDCKTVLKTGTANEKGGKIRSFVIFQALKEALEEYRNANGSFFVSANHFLFPYRLRSSENAHLLNGTIGKVFKKVCKRAGVEGDQVHPHACRKTVVVNLMKDGNTIDNVAKFIGHANPITTAQHYWVTTPAELVASMNTSWLTSPPFQDLDVEQMHKIAINTAEGIKAQERLIHALSIMSPEQIKKMEKMWDKDTDQSVAARTKEIISKIIKASSD